MAEHADLVTADQSMGAQGSELLRRLYFSKAQGIPSNEKDDRALVNLVLDHAKRVIRHPTHPPITEKDSFLRNPFGELDIEELLEESPIVSDADDLVVTVKRDKPFTCVALLDASSSMAGDKHLLASVAVAVLLLEVPSRDVSLTLFSSNARTIKRLQTEEAVEATILKFLATQPVGFTNIGEGLKAGLREYNRLGTRRRKVALIATDGRTTEGVDPYDVASEYDFLVVLHLHGPGSHLESSRAMAQKGKGVCLEVNHFEDLPKKLYDALRLIARM